MNLKTLIGNHAYWIINKALYRKLGWNAALLLQHLIDIEEVYFKGKREFFQQVDRLNHDLGLSKHEIRKAKKLLIEAGLISIVKKGRPAKDHFKLHKTEILKIFTSTGLKSEPVVVHEVDDKDKESTETNNQQNTKNIKEVIKKSLDAGTPQAGTETGLDSKFNFLFERVEQAFESRRIKIGNRAKAFQFFKIIGNEVAEGLIYRLANDWNFKPTSLEDWLEDEVTVMD